MRLLLLRHGESLHSQRVIIASATGCPGLTECGHRQAGRLDAHHIVVRIWAAERKRRDFPLEVRLRYDDPWLNYGPVISAASDVRNSVFQLTPLQPGEVRTIIDAAIDVGWEPHHPRDGRRFTWDRAGMLSVW